MITSSCVAGFSFSFSFSFQVSWCSLFELITGVDVTSEPKEKKIYIFSFQPWVVQLVLFCEVISSDHFRF